MKICISMSCPEPPSFTPLLLGFQPFTTALLTALRLRSIFLLFSCIN